MLVFLLVGAVLGRIGSWGKRGLYWDALAVLGCIEMPWLYWGVLGQTSHIRPCHCVPWLVSHRSPPLYNTHKISNKRFERDLFCLKDTRKHKNLCLIAFFIIPSALNRYISMWPWPILSNCLWWGHIQEQKIFSPKIESLPKDPILHEGECQIYFCPIWVALTLFANFRRENDQSKLEWKCNTHTTAMLVPFEQRKRVFTNLNCKMGKKSQQKDITDIFDTTTDILNGTTRPEINWHDVQNS